MYLLPNLVRHNAWANRTVFDAFNANPAVLDVVCYDGDALRSRLQHQLGTERAFLDILKDDLKRPQPPSDLAALVAYEAETAAGLLAATLELGEAAQERAFLVPWFRREFPMHALVTQALGHSAQHRSELAWELARAGTSTGELDLIIWLASGEPAPGEPLRMPDA